MSLQSSEKCRARFPNSMSEKVKYVLQTTSYYKSFLCDVAIWATLKLQKKSILPNWLEGFYNSTGYEY